MHSFSMRPSLAIWLLLSTCVIATTLVAQKADSSTPLTLTQYIQVLDNSLAALDKVKGNPHLASEVTGTLPSAWHVEVDGKTFEISTESVRRDLAAWQAKPASVSLELIGQHLQTLRYQAVAYETGAQDFSSWRSSLNGILARSEFRNVRGQNWVDRLKGRISELLLRWLSKIVRTSAIPMISDIVVYGLIVVAVIALAYWLYRSLREGTRLETLMPAALPVSAKEWPTWLSEARAAAARCDWRAAIHLAYRGGISFLEAQGAWRPDRARTPREYLRLLPANSVHQAALRALTMQLEGVWYGMQLAGADRFEQTLAELERLGCPCN